MAVRHKFKVDGKFCCVPFCKSTGNQIPRPSFHKFPHENEINAASPLRRAQWKVLLKIDKTITKNMVVCSRHFKTSDFIYNTNSFGSIFIKRPRLKMTSIPSENLPSLCLGSKTKSNSSISKCRKNFQGRKLDQNKTEAKSIEMAAEASISSQGEVNDKSDVEFGDGSSLEELSTQLRALEAEKQILTGLLENLNSNIRKEPAANAFKINNASTSPLKQRFFVLRCVTN